MNALETLRDDGLHAEQRSAFGCPIARAAGAVLLPCQHYERNFVLAIFHGRVINAHDFAARLIFGYAALSAGSHEVLDAHIGEGTTRHHAVIAAARAVAVEVFH